MWSGNAGFSEICEICCDKISCCAALVASEFGVSPGTLLPSLPLVLRAGGPPPSLPLVCSEEDPEDRLNSKTLLSLSCSPVVRLGGAPPAAGGPALAPVEAPDDGAPADDEVALPAPEMPRLGFDTLGGALVTVRSATF